LSVFLGFGSGTGSADVPDDELEEEGSSDSTSKILLAF
jgi:hypothetical protein